MDEVRIKTAFTKNIIKTIMKRILKKKLGYNVDICLDDFHLRIDPINNVAFMRIDAEIQMDANELSKMILNNCR